MIRRSTLVFFTCLGALGVPAVASSLAVAEAAQAPVLVAQALEEAPPTALSIGSRGLAVRTLQNQLKETGFYDGRIDGIYGLATQKAVTAFQASQGFEPTGRLDDETWEALEAFDPQTAEQTVPNEAEEAVSPSSPPEESPTAGESAVGAPAGIETDSSGLSKVVGIGIGLAAVLASFGVGFFMANRSKAATEDDLQEGDEWGSAGIDAAASTGAGTAPSTYNNSEPNFGTSNETAQNGLATGGAAAGTANTMATVPTARNGQLGGTAPMGQADIFEGLIKDLHNPDPHKRRKVIWELGQRGNSLAVQPLVDAMIDADSKEKSLVLAALSEIGMRSLRPMNRALAIALQDDNPEVRKNAIRDLTRIYELVVQISQMLGHAQEDEDPEVRQTASWALEQLNRIRQTQDIDSNMRSLPTTNTPKTNRFAL